MKTFVGIVRDHSASMRPITNKAMEDFNSIVESIRSSDQETFVTSIMCGVNRIHVRQVTNEVVAINVPVKEVPVLKSYEATGTGTPLFDSVMLAIKSLSENVKVKDANDPMTSYLVMVVTDGGENASTTKDKELAEKIRELQATDKWSFVFRVPRGYKGALTRLGIPDGNILEWDVSSEGMHHSTIETSSAISNYFVEKIKGVTSTFRFYADTSNLTKEVVSSVLTDVTAKVRIAPVSDEKHGTDIKSFCNEYFGQFVKGKAYYQLTKAEEVQPQKSVIVQDKSDYKFYAGNDARNLLGLNSNGYIRVHPGNLSKYNVFVQSTSVNRKLVKGTTVVYEI